MKHSPQLRQARSALIALAAGVALAACSGGNGYDEGASTPQAATEVPATALASPGAYTEFARTLTNSETAKPLGVNTVVMPPTSETAMPVAL
jgi:ABC-type glycerol-3-phosphate transport system substrate-binding protein